ncbi:pre-mRNA-splicing factor cwc22 [Apiospora saccharicola]
MRAAGCLLLSVIDESLTFCHSGSCQYKVLLADACPEMIRASVNLESTCLPFQSVTAEEKQAAAKAEYEKLLNARSGSLYIPPARLVASSMLK